MSSTARLTIFVKRCCVCSTTKRNMRMGRYTASFNDAITGFGVLYNKRYDATTQAIEQSVGMRGGERYYNIVLALLRLIEKNNDACGRFRSPALLDLYPYTRRLKEAGLPYEDKGHAIEVIIDSASQSVIGLARFKKILTE